MRSEPWTVDCKTRVPSEVHIPRTVEKLFTGWWLVESPWIRCHHYCYTQRVRQVFTGDGHCMDLSRGPFPTREQAEEFMYRDSLESYWEHGLAVWADHCLQCGKFAKVLAFDSAGGWAWRVTECKSCGITDSRETC